MHLSKPVSGDAASVVMLTPSYADDLERLRLLLESRIRLGIEIPHVIVGDTEDVDLVTAVVPPGSATVIATADVLPARVEQWRRRFRLSRRDPRRWAGGRIPGWWTQQLVKLAFTASAAEEAVVCVDSDVVFVQPVAAIDFVEVTGRPKLFESPTKNDLTAGWTVRAMEFLGIAPQDTEPMGYIHNPVVMSKKVVAALGEHISARRRQDWMEAILGSGSTEYQLHGVFATYFTPAWIAKTPPLAAVNFWSPRHGDPREHLYERVKGMQAKVVGIQSTLGFPVETYRPLLERIWDEA